jgi:hypothetical protein
MKTKLVYTLLAIMAAVGAGLIFLSRQPAPEPVRPEASPTEQQVAAKPTEPAQPIREPVEKRERPGAPAQLAPIPPQSPAKPPAALSKPERLAQIRENFRTLAAGEPRAALTAARLITDETEREAALLTLVTEWRHGELHSPRERAAAIASLGLEAGLGLELAKNPELAIQWASELTEGPGRAAVLAQAAITLLDTDPAAAFALSGQLPEAERKQFLDSVIGGWAAKDTDAALKWAEQLPDPSDQAGALQAIRAVAPVGIGTEMAVQDGVPVIRRLLPGAAAELSGQIQPGDRILAVGDGNNSFVDARGVPLADLVQMIRGAPGTLVQLQLLPADAPPNSLPRTVSIVRGQIKLKQ